MGGRSDYEIILVNDASTDGTLEQMQGLAAADPRIVANRGARLWFRAFASKGFTTLINWVFWLTGVPCSNVISCSAAPTVAMRPQREGSFWSCRILSASTPRRVDLHSYASTRHPANLHRDTDFNPRSSK
jgi:glycosyltransferase involved in cell wall biosynthesis